METADDLVELFRTADPAKMMVWKSVLESAEIAYVVQGEESLGLNSWGLSGSLFGPSSSGAILLIRREDLEVAGLLFRESIPASDPEA